MTRDEATILDIVKAAHLVLAFMGDMPKEVFLSDLKTQSAVLHQLTILGEAVKRLSRSFRDQHATIPWSLMGGCGITSFTAMIRLISMKFGTRSHAIFLNCWRNLSHYSLLTRKVHDGYKHRDYYQRYRTPKHS
jgi:hypothetical protein